MSDSPCLNVCLYDDATGICMSCGLTAEESQKWDRIPEDERLRILDELPKRMEN